MRQQNKGGGASVMKGKKPQPVEEASQGSQDWQTQDGELVPPERLDLSEEEIDETITKLLKAKNPQAPDNIMNFSFQENEWKSLNPVEHTAFHFKEDGKLLHVETEEAKKMKAKIESGQQETRLRNQFNFSERAAQSYENPSRDRAMSTDPPPMVPFSETATQWSIYDAYMEHKKAAQKREERERFRGHHAQDEDQDKDIEEERQQDLMHSEDLLHSLKVVERMAIQNQHAEIAYDFKYWDDPSDSVNEGGKGNLLPMWRFTYEKTKKKHVTGITWNPVYKDMFLVCYGSYDFVKQTGGGFACFSLKNPVYPERVFLTETGIMCGDFHPNHPSLIALGMYDGAVMVYDVRQKENEPIFKSTPKKWKHKDPVWQVKWQDSDLSKELSFISISSDGKVMNWTLGKNELHHTEVLELKASTMKIKSLDIEALSSGLEGGCSMEFSKHDPSLFLVGTEEGNVRLCSKAYSNEYLHSFDAHFMAVYSVRWNSFHTEVFLTASEDWTIKIWKTDSSTPAMTFDLGSAVGDVAWAPYSSTLFAAVTADGRIRVFDLSVNKYEPLCDEIIVKKAKLTHIAFNPKEPVLLIGDERGTVVSVKLSPNLRKMPKLRPNEDGEKPTLAQHEKQKIEALIERAKALEAS